MNLPAFVTEALEQALGEAPHTAVAVGGGCIHEAARVETSSGPVFAKWSASAEPRMFELEAAGLRQLRDTATISVPEVIAQTAQALVLSWVEPSPSRGLAMRDAGHQLAALHEQRGHRPGGDQDGYIGRLVQTNVSEASSTWLEFFRRHRVEALTPCLPTGLRTRIEAIDFEGLLDEPAGGCALLHGDLWGGNLVCGADGLGWF